MNKRKFLYSFEEVAKYSGVTKQTLCNWSGCNKGYHVNSMKNKKRAAAALFIFYHLYGKRNIKKIKENLKALKEKCGAKEEIKKIEKEIETLNSFYTKIKKGWKK
jgi:hypothetical protein